MSTSASAFACILAFGVTLWVATRAVPETHPRVWAWLELALAGALVTYLADNLVTMALGWTLAAAASAWLAGWSDRRAGAPVATRSALALVTLWLGGGWLFWGAGGTWDDGVYTRDHVPRFSVLRTAEEAHGVGSVTLLDAPGASAYLDEARAPLATAPFAGVRVPPGAHVLRVHPGFAAQDQVLDLDVPEEGATFVVVPSGPSLSFRAWALARVSALAAAPPTADAEDLHEGVVAAALWAWIAAAWALSAMRPPAGAPVSFAALAYGATTAPLGPFLLARASVFAPMARGMKLALAAAGAAILVVSAEALWAAATLRPSRGASWWRQALEFAPLRAGALLERFERWVLDATSEVTIGSLVVAGSIVDNADRQSPFASRRPLPPRRPRRRGGVEDWLGVGPQPLLAIVIVLAAAAYAGRVLWVACRGGSR